MTITFAGDKITLLGNQVKEGDKAPAFKATKTIYQNLTQKILKEKL